MLRTVVNPDHDRDRLLEDALTHELRAAGTPPATGACLDAETVAAWMDGGLAPDAMVMAEAHASNCARCQALLGTLVRTTPAVAVTEAHGSSLWRWWMAPLAASAAALTLWIVVPAEPVVAPVDPPAAVVLPSAPEAARLGQASPAEPAPPRSAAESKRLARNRADVPAPKVNADAGKPDAQAFAGLEKRKEEAANVADTTAEARVAAAPAAASQRAQAAALPDARVTARSSPSPDVIWFVGRQGIVFLATDGRTFLRLPFPEAIDLTAVTATDERHAVVTADDGRVFETADGGRTWTRP